MKLALALALCACGSKADKAPAATGSGSDAVVQPRFQNGQAVASDEGTLGFTITKVHTEQQPTETAPFFAAGGEWTYVEAHLDGDPAATFVVGMPRLEGDGPGFAKMMVAPTTREAGTRVIAALAKTLGVTAPAPTSGVLQPMKVPIAVLGRGMSKLANGYGGTGTWDTTKLFCSTGDIEAAELFFNLSIADKRGVFAEKDTDYNRDVVACLAIALRDGGLPPRTAATDPTLAAKPIRFVRGKQISKHRAEEVSLAPARVLVAEERGDSAALLQVDLRTGATKELFKTPERIEWGRCDDTVTRCLLKLSMPTEARNSFGGKDRPHLAILEGTKVTPLDIPGIELPTLTLAPFSPDGRWVVAETLEELVAFDRKTKQKRTLAKADNSMEVATWAKDGDKWIAVVTQQENDEPPKVLDWHLDAGGAATPSNRPVPQDRSPVSPDGKRRADFSDGKVVVTVGGKPRTLALYATDARQAQPDCCYWLDNRVVWMPGGFLDTDTMKVSPRDADDEGRIAFIPGTRSALVIGDDGTWLANLVVP